MPLRDSIRLTDLLRTQDHLDDLCLRHVPPKKKKILAPTAS